jgi:hypothetical protein
MEYFCITRKEERERENREKKARHVTPKRMAERNQSTKAGPEAKEFLLAEQDLDVQLGRLGKWLRSVLLHASGTRPGRRTPQTAALG